MQQIKQMLQRYPWIVYIPLWALWIVLNFTGRGAWIGPTVIRQLISGPTTDLNVIFPITWISAIVSFISIIYFLRNRTSFFNSLAISAASQLGAAFLFEFVFSIIALFIHGHQILEGDPYYIGIGLSWLIMPICGMGFWSWNQHLKTSIGLFLVGFFIWSAIGFPILKGVDSIALNYLTKIASFYIFTSLYISE
jgi:hypothetical protein